MVTNSMREASIWIEGEPATFATKGEAPWKQLLHENVPPSALDGRETGLSLNFSVSSLLRHGQPFDVDNLCDPVFSVLIGQKGWFGGKKPGLAWWSATKRQGTPPGCHIAIYAKRSIVLPSQSPFWDEVFPGPLSVHGTSPELARRALALRVARGVNWIPEKCSLYLGFADANLNIGDISTGRVKAAVDCLYPWLGGTAGHGEDWRVETLIVERGLEHLREGAVNVRLWEPGRISADLPDVTFSAPEKRRRTNDQYEQRLMNGGKVPILNPCREGTRIWTVCQAAIERKTLADVRAELDRHASGAGARLHDYKADLRYGKKLDIRIEGDRIVCYGALER